MASQGARYDLIRDFQTELRDDLQGVSDPHYLGKASFWALAVVQLGRPQSFSRRTFKSLGSVVEGAFTRRAKPFVITDASHVTISGSKRSHTKTLEATLPPTANYLSQTAVAPGDWLLAWCWSNEEDARRVLKQVRDGQAANGFGDGLKFVGRVHSVRKGVDVEPGGTQNSSYSLQGVGFEELDTSFFYDFALATAAAVKNDIRPFMAQLGLEFSKWAEQAQMAAGNISDNADRVITALIDVIVGKGVAATINTPVERGAAAAALLGSSVGGGLKLAPQANKEAPFAYLVPVSVATMLGRDPTERSKERVFGYADILDTLIGVQRYTANASNTTATFTPDLFYPALAAESTRSRKKTDTPLKGTFLPVNPSFVNQPLFQLLQQFLNPTINEMYTALRTDENGAVMPTLVVRQIPFSTEAIRERPEFPLTRFLALPRWVVAPVMVRGYNVGRSNATRVNMIHVYGDASAYASNRSVTNQMVRNPPIFDATDIQRSGIRPLMRTVNCALADQVRVDGARIWMEAIADWTIGSQYTLNGSLHLAGVQSPVAEGDNVEFDGVVYHVEAVTHDCSMGPDGQKSFITTLEVSNGMPADQGEALDDFPRYPGFQNTAVSVPRDAASRPPTMEAPEAEGVPPPDDGVTDTTTTGDDDALTQLDPGVHSESALPDND